MTSGRNKSNQTAHDKRISEEARDYIQRKYDVDADHVKGYDQPESISGYIPDLRVRKRGHETVIEVETTDSVGKTRDINQQKAFREWRNKKKSTRHYRLIVV